MKRSGANITFRCAGQKQNIRLRSIGEGCAEDELRTVLAGEKKHTPRKKRAVNEPKKDTLLIHKQNIGAILGRDARKAEKEKEQERC